MRLGDKLISSSTEELPSVVASVAGGRHLTYTGTIHQAPRGPTASRLSGPRDRAWGLKPSAWKRTKPPPPPILGIRSRGFGRDPVAVVVRRFWTIFKQ